MNQTKCDQCGKVDDHPKVHVANGGTFHHDCVSADLRQSLIESNPLAEGIITAAESGKHGEDLRKHISSVHGKAAK